MLIGTEGTRSPAVFTSAANAPSIKHIMQYKKEGWTAQPLNS
jgi:hypothetical protein